MTTDQSTTGQAKQAASTAAEEGKHVGAVAKDEAQNVIGTAAGQARSVAGDTVSQIRDQLTEQTSGQRDRLVSTLGSLGDDLERMAGQADGGGMAADLAREVASRAHSLKNHLDGREPGQLLDDVRDFARRKPGTFLLGAVAAGVVAGRLFRATADGAAAASLNPTPSPTPTGIPGGMPTGTPTGASTGLTGGSGDLGRPGTGAADDPLSAPPTVSSGSAGIATTPPGPPLPPSTPGQPTIEAP